MGLFGNKPPQKQLPGQVAPMQPDANGVVKGTVERCACPWCAKVFSLKDVEDYGLEVGAEFQCDNPQCRRFFALRRIQPVVHVWVQRIAQPSGFNKG